MFLSVVGNLFVYWCTSQAFTSSPEFAEYVQGDYFTFVLLGEAVLMIPMALLTAFTQSLRTLNDGGVVDLFFLSQRSSLTTLFVMSSSLVLLQALQMLLTVFLGGVVFSLQIQWSQWPEFFLFLLSGLPLFCGLGLLNGAAVLFLRRGDHFLLSVSGVLAVLSGVYFPVQVFPTWAQSLLAVSPWTHWLEQGRALLAGDLGHSYSRTLIPAVDGAGGSGLNRVIAPIAGPSMPGGMVWWLLIGGPVLLISLFLFQWALQVCRKRGESKVLWR